MAMKLCASCKLSKPLEEFNQKRGGKSRQSSCRKCAKVYAKQHYAENKADYLRRIAARKRELLEFIRALKEGQPCVDCGSSYHPCAMDFDHLDGSAKAMGVVNMAAYGVSKERILLEIKKCELVCANCHRVRTHSRNYSGVV